MLFTKNNRFKDNFLVAYIGTYAEKLYKNFEYEIYDEIHNKYENGGKATQEDIAAAIKNFRMMIAHKFLEATEREYQGTIEQAEHFLTTLQIEDYDKVNTYGPDVSVVYSIVVKMVKGEEYEFKFLEGTDYMPDSAKDIDYEKMPGAMITKIQSFEESAISASLDMLIMDGIIDAYPEY